MRFLIAGHFSMSWNLASGFIANGHEVCYFPKSSPVANSYDEAYTNLYNLVRDIPCDYVVWLGACHAHFKGAPDACKDFGKGLIYWATEDPIKYNENEIMFSSADLILSTAIENVEEYRQRGLKANLMQFACDPDYHYYGKYNPTYDCDLMFQCSYYNWEARQRGYDIILDAAIELYLEEGLNLQVYGAFWDTTGSERLKHMELYKGFMNNDHLVDVAASSKITLGVQCCDSSISQQSMRGYELLGCRAFHIAQYTPAVANTFKDGEHLVMARTKEEAKEKIKYYLKHPEERDIIAKQGQEYVYKNHTYKQRVAECILPYLSR